MATIGKPLTVPESGWERLDNQNASISYVGTGWKSAPSSSYYNGTASYTYISTDKVLFSFSGTGIRLISINDNYTAPTASIKIDGVLQTYTQFHASGNQVLVFEKMGMPYTLHTVEIIASGATSSVNFNLDAIDIYQPKINKVLVLNAAAYKKYSSGSWQIVSSSTVIESHFLDGNSLEELSSIPESSWSQLTGDVELCYYTDDLTKTEAQFGIETTPFTLAEEWEDKTIKIIEYTDNPNQTESTITLETEPFTLYDELGDTVDVLYYTDDTSKTSANLSVTANYSPLDEINGDFEVVTWTDNDIEVGSEPTLTYEGLPFEQLLLQPQDFKVHGTIKSIVATKITQTSEGKMRFIASFDSGATWKTYRFGKWKLINVSDLATISKKGMTIDTLNTIPEKDLVGLTRIGYYLDNSIHNSAEKTQLDVVKTIQLAPTQDVKFSDVAFYLLNTTATIQLQLQGNKLVGTLDDADQTRVQYRVILNGNPYYPLNGEFSPLMPSPLNIQLNLSEKDVVFGQDNTLKVEFQDYWGQVDSWQTTFVGTYSGIMFKDVGGNFYSNSFGEILKRLEFGTLFAGQTTLEQKVVVKNQLGVKVQNLLLEIVKEKLPPGVSIELSRSNFPFTPEDPLLFNMFFDVDQEFEFYVRIVTQLTAPTAANGQFEIRAKADPV